MLRRSLDGPFTGEDLGHGRWLLSGPAASEIHLHVVEPSAATALSAPGVTRVEVDWQSGMLLLARGTRIAQVPVHSASVHEFPAALYAALPLAGFDRKARNFWRRVFLLMRLPGGRLLLRIIARPRG
jgi:hypothetical protein